MDTPKSVDYSTVSDRLPGYGYPLHYVPGTGVAEYISDTFPNALMSEDDQDTRASASLPLTTLREFIMLRFMNAITDKPDWHVKIFDEAIADKWKAEGIESTKSISPQIIKSRDLYRYSDDEDEDRDNDDSDSSESDDEGNAGAGGPEVLEGLTEKMAEFCIQELRWRAEKFKESPSGAIIVYNGNVVKSDQAVSAETKFEIQRLVKPLEDVPNNQKDWHPGSDEKVLDLVHPSLFPLVYGKSRILHVGAKVTTLDDCITRCGEGEVLPKKMIQPGHDWIDAGALSERFQWLPCEVDISGDKAKILTYINNLHPGRFSQLYGAIEDVITAAIPLWGVTLAPLSREFGSYHQRIVYENVEYNPDPENAPQTEGPQPGPGETVASAAYWDRRERWIKATRRLVYPEPADEFNADNFETYTDYDLKQEYGKLGRPLQIIVKLANIELTPEKPEYEGGTWHVEGQLNEHIVATALYYYSCENITFSELGFRQIADEEMAQEISYPQSDFEFMEKIFGCDGDGPTIQTVGTVQTKEGRLITFPNILQHQVQPFKLADPTKPGHRKIIALFLVDPNVRVISTAYVPSQRMDWWREELLKKSESGVGKSEKALLHSIPLELQDEVFESVDSFPISLKEAKEIRKELMEERKTFVRNQGRALATTSFSLCEH